MRRPFLRVYLMVCVAVLAVSMLWALGARRELSHAVEHRIEAALSPGIRMARDRMRGGPPERPGPRRRAELEDHLREEGRERFLAALSDAWRVEATIRAPGAVTLRPRDRERVERGDVVFAPQRRTGPLLVAELDREEWLVLGPLERPPGERLVLGTLWRVSLALALIGGVLLLALGPYERRLQRLADAAGELGDGAWGVRVNETAADAVGEVGRAFDQMAARIGDVVERQQELFAGVSHELRTPLARLLFLLEELEDADDAEQRARHVARAVASVEEIDGMVRELLTLARVDGGRTTLAEVSLAALVAAATDAVPAGAVGVEVTACDGLAVMADDTLATRALTNVLANAVRHATSQVRVHAEARGEVVRVYVDDDGAGIPPADRTRVFDAFTQLDSSRGERGASGLGLAIVARSMKAQGGSASATESPSGGARLVLEFVSA